MRLPALVAVIGLGFVSAYADDAMPEFAQDDPARIWIDGDAVHFFGAISAGSQTVFETFVLSEDISGVRRFVVNYLGGDTHVGRAVGRWIFAAGLDVEVNALCLSSCADYIFPAGKGKAIRAASFVGWHGSEGQYTVIAQSMPGQSGEDLERAALRAALIPALPEGASNEVIDGAVDEQIALSDASREDEDELFDTIGISSEFTLHGMRPSNVDKWRESGLEGWTYSLSDMAQLDLGPVIFLGEGDYATSRQVRRNFYVVPFNPELAPAE